MRPALLPIAELDDRARGRWRELTAAAIEPNPFFEAEMVEPAAETLGAKASLLVAIDEEGDWAGCVPVHRGIRWREVPFPALACWRHLYCFLGTPLARGDRLGEVFECWLGSEGPSRRPFLGFDRMSADGPVAEALEQAASDAGTPLIRYEEFTRATLERDREGPHLGVNTKHRRELDRQWRRLGEKVDGALEIRDRSGSDSAIEDFLRVEASGWKGREGTAFACDDAHAEFFRRICRNLAAQGRLEMLSLDAGGEPIALKCNIRAGAGVFAFKIGFDESYSSYSPGIHLERHTVEHLDDAPPEVKWLDTCADPDNRMSKRVWPDRRAIAALAVPAPGPAGVVGRAGLAVGARVNVRRKGTAA